MPKAILQISTLFFILFTTSIDSFGQNLERINFDSLRNILKTNSEDSSYVSTLLELSARYTYHITDSALYYGKRALALSEKIDFKKGVAYSCWTIATNLSQLGHYPDALRYGYRALGVFRDLKHPGGEIVVTEQIGTIYRDQGDLEQALNFLMKARKMTLALKPGTDLKMYPGSTRELTLFYQNTEIAFCYISSNPDSSLYYINQLFLESKWSYKAYVKGRAFQQLKQYDSAIHYYRFGLSTNFASPIDLTDIHIGLAQIFSKKELRDSSLVHAKVALHLAQSASLIRGIHEASEILAREYSQVDPKQSIFYYQLHKITGDTLYNQQKVRASQYLTFTQELGEREAQQRLNQANLEYKNRIRLVVLSGSILVLLIIAVGLWRRNIFKQKSFARLQMQNQEIDNQKTIVEKTLKELKSTQSQLIQSEKMASLGELTAGIAHEIQNPLNFVNNFSEVNIELTDDLKSGLNKSTLPADEKNNLVTLVDDIVQNQEKINHHGKRADAIVKGMLQHSRIGSGVKEPTNINALVDEYLRLAYHGLRAKDKSFNATMKKDFDETIGYINVVAQDIGRVILNLISNAFYAVAAKASSTADGKYDPTVSVSTKKIGDKVEVRVADNGNGISPKILDKIFQPFFTTKPTGQGTGLGLSLAYDIVKAHGGEIRVETKEGEGSEFIVQL